jgi:hypothetical protein
VIIDLDVIEVAATTFMQSLKRGLLSSSIPRYLQWRHGISGEPTATALNSQIA